MGLFSLHVAPSPLEHGCTMEDGHCVSLEYTRPALPKRLNTNEGRATGISHGI